MLSVHYNGDIVKHPDTAKLYAERMELYSARGRCKFGQREIYCPVYMDYIKRNKQIKHLELFSRCQEYKRKLYPATVFKCTSPAPVKVKIKPINFFRPPVCPYVKELKRRGEIQKTYKIDNSTYRKIASAGHNLIRK